MKFASWNVNGLRAVLKRNDFAPFLKLDADVFCLQETKARPEQLPEDIVNLEGYHSYYTFPTIKKGYSGVAIYSKKEPTEVTYGMGIEEMDQEGRLITAHFDTFIFIGGYYPNGGGAPERFEYKLDFFDAFLEYADNLRATGKPVIFCGDVNVAHEEIDLTHPKTNQDNPGFRPEVREWVDEVIRHGWVDTFRHLNPGKTECYSYWDMKSAARDRNVGWRIDYFFISPDLAKKLKNAYIWSDLYGSDHCPVGIDIDV